ncbi:c-type cytochrome [Phenylobacterium sp. VNQ135]|uniref:c-type cytochrome n=1 Tax=Phenylobacterium sp. VNQ135 TaxID=3400922 RepID=UPI003C074B32
MPRPLQILIAASVLLSGCASTGPTPVAVSDPAVDRGQAFAARRCGGCHAIGLDASPAASGPPFWKLQRRYNPLSLQKRFAEVSEHGSGEMPPIEISRAEAEDLIAYFRTLDR